MMKRILAAGLCLLLIGCGKTADSEQPAEAAVSAQPAETSASEENTETQTEEEVAVMKMYINETELQVQWEDNPAVAALTEMSSEPVTVQMSMYGGFEQVGPLGTSLPHDDTRITTQAGDIVLYQGNQIVVFYGSNTWEYTKLGHIVSADAAELAKLLGNGDVTIVLKR